MSNVFLFDAIASILFALFGFPAIFFLLEFSSMSFFLNSWFIRSIDISVKKFLALHYNNCNLIYMCRMQFNVLVPFLTFFMAKIHFVNENLKKKIGLKTIDSVNFEMWFARKSSRQVSSIFPIRQRELSYWIDIILITSSQQ